jgi:MIP family channel proteins/HAD superfamily hydrolase (TIGR01509 family)
VTETAHVPVVETPEQIADETPGEPTLRSGVVGEVVGCIVLGFLGLSVGLAGGFNREGVVWTSDIWPVMFGWAFAIALAIFIAAPLSGAHFNPAVTIALATSGRFPWRKVPAYIVSDLVGWFLGAALAVLMLGGTMRAAADRAGVKFGAPGSETIASSLTTYVPAPGFGTGGAAYREFPIWRGFVGEILGTAVLVLVVLALSESRHITAPAEWFFPLIVGTTVGMVILIEAPLSQASLNPARDLGPRTMLLVLGFGKIAFPGPRGVLALLVTTIGPIIGALLGLLIHDGVIRRTLATLQVKPLPRIENPGDMAREPAVLTRLPGDLGPLPAAAGDGRGGPIELVTFDMGGSLYDDDGWAQALKQAVSELAGDRFDEQAFWDEYNQQRESQGDLRTAMANRFGVDRAQIHDLAGRYLNYGPNHLYPEVAPTLRALAGRYKLAVIANQDERVLEALRRDRLFELFDVLGLAKAAGAMKPDPRIWRYALAQAGVAPHQAVHIGNRLDADVRPAKQLGMRTIWLLRGEAPSSPTIQQLSEADAVITSLAQAPAVIAGFASQAAPTVGAGAAGGRS